MTELFRQIHLDRPSRRPGQWGSRLPHAAPAVSAAVIRPCRVDDFPAAILRHRRHGANRALPLSDYIGPLASPAQILEVAYDGPATTALHPDYVHERWAFSVAVDLEQAQ